MERLIVWQRCIVSARDDEAENHARWTQHVVEFLERAGGEILASLGSSVIAAFDPVDTASVLEATLALVHEAEEAAAAGGPPIAIGITHGEVTAIEGGELAPITFVGVAIDRAQSLANRARSGEIVLDSSAHEHASEAFLFSRSVGIGALRGLAIDRAFPRKHDCRDAVRLLQPAPLAPSEEAFLDQLRALPATPGGHRIVLRGSSPAALMSLINAAREEIQPPICLHMGRQAGGLQPLGGLQLSLRRCLGPVEVRVVQAFGALGLSDEVLDALQSIADGAAIARVEAVAALRALLEAASNAATPPWIVLESLHDIDAASLGVLADAGLRPDSRVVLLTTVSGDGAIPATLTKGGELHDVSVAPLRMPEARNIAERVLGLEAGSDVARRVAMLGGDTRIGVVEAARTLITAGDLIHDGHKFVWRTGPREGGGAVTVDALLAERINGLDPAAYRMLEVVCTSAPCAPRSRISAAATFDGLEEGDHDRAIVVLRAEGLLDPHGNLEPASGLVRTAFRANMPPARVAELHRYTIEAVRSESVMQDDTCFARALLGFHLAEGGLEKEAAVALLAAAQGALRASFPRSAVRLAAAAVQLDGSVETRALASTIARAVEKPSTAIESQTRETPSTPPPSDGHAGAPASRSDSSRIVRQATRASIEAIFARDFEAVERFVDTAVAAGQTQAAADRVRAMAHLARGNVGDALRTLENAAAQRDLVQPTPRDAIASALVQLQSGHAGEAIRSALDALGTARAREDRAGQAASMHVLAACFMAIDRKADAQTILSGASSL